MTVYLLYMASPTLIYFLLQLCTRKSVNRNEKTRNIYLTLVGIVMVLMIGLRNPGNGSGDTQFYYDFWETMSRMSFSELKYNINNFDLEIGYQITNWVLSKIFHNGQWLLFLSGLFFSVSVCSFAKKNCKNLVLALTVFNCLGLFNFMVQGLRQAIAMCICLWALEQCKNRKLIKFLLLVLLAMSFHASAIVFVVVYVLKDLKLNVKGYFLTAFSALILAFLLPRIFEIVNLLINDSYEIGTESSDGGIIAILIYVAVLAFGLIFRDKNDSSYALFIYMATVGAAAMIMRNSVSAIAERISHYFAFAQMVVIANSVTSVKDKRVGLIISILIIVLCFGVAVHKASYTNLVPYLFYWQI